MQITYILGAGASANALPLIKSNPNSGTPGLPQQLKFFVEQNKSFLLTKNQNWDSRDLDLLNEIVEKCIEFGSPDLYAKFLLESDDNSTYHFLKSLLSLFFKYKQEITQAFDVRALTFLTTISENQRIPETIKILSWNYDSQIEIAAERLKPVSSRVYTKIKGFTVWPNMRDGEERNTGQPFLLHLNGVAGFMYSKSNFYDKINENYDFTSLEDKEHLLSFAWEDENSTEKKMFIEQRLDVAKQIAAKTEILVIVGYSFPFFNRKIDKEIFKAMKNSLRKIYYQDPRLDGNQLKAQFDLSDIAASNIEHVSQVENYHIPFEL